MVNVNGSSALMTSAGKQPVTAAQVMPHAREFESILLSQWLQGAESSFGSVPGGDENQDAGDEQFRSFAVQQLAKSLTNSGGFGIAQIVAKALAHNALGEANAKLDSKSNGK